MSYPNFLGEFVAQLTQDDWVNHVRWNERKPVQTRGALDPWKIERTRLVWQKEKETWPAIEKLKLEYATREKQMRYDIAVFNEHLAELERVTGKKVGLGPIGSYGGMALAVIPGFGWFSAAFTVISMGLEMLMGNKKKKRVNELMGIMQDAQERLKRNQQRLQVIQTEIKVLMGVTEQAQAANESARQAGLTSMKSAQQRLDDQRSIHHLLIDQELTRIRQVVPDRVSYGNAL